MVPRHIGVTRKSLVPREINCMVVGCVVAGRPAYRVRAAGAPAGAKALGASPPRQHMRQSGMPAMGTFDGTSIVRR
jgi:hypothetical protein